MAEDSETPPTGASLEPIELDEKPVLGRGPPVADLGSSELATTSYSVELRSSSHEGRHDQYNHSPDHSHGNGHILRIDEDNGSVAGSEASTASNSRDRVRQRKPPRRDREWERAYAMDFSRRDRYGLLYTSENHWDELVNLVEDCHICLASSSIVLPSDKARGALVENSSMTDEESALQPMPIWLRITNRLLYEEVGAICLGPERKYLMNPNHAAPFRHMIPYEDDLRARHQELEAQFIRMAEDNPNHSAVTRQHTVVPPWCMRLSQTEHAGYPRDRINQARILLDGFRALVRLLDTSLSSLVDSYRRIKAGTIEVLPFSHLWFLFEPGQEIIQKQSTYQACRVLQVTGGRRSLKSRHQGSKEKKKTVSPLVIDCFYLDFDGYTFGPVSKVIIIPPYEDTKPIGKLNVYPLALHKPSKNESLTEPLSKVLLNRGLKFRSLTTVSRRRYRGLSIKQPPEEFQTIQEIDSEVIIDFELAYRKIDPPVFGGGVITNGTEEDQAESSRDTTHDNCRFWDDNTETKSYWSQWLQNTDLLLQCAPAALSDDAARLLPARVYGYVLLNRKWSPLDIDLIGTIPVIKPGETDGFEKLVLPPGHRDIVRALVQTHARKVDADGNTTKGEKSQREFDVVKGKGKGLIILLHGAPGVGKTSTAECVASNAGRPLFPITCGDLGAETAQEVEANLEKFFSLARKWDCVLLLDEADVFLSARVEGNIRQNSLVSVFLRVLEYYSGILVLTTNRVGSFDEAIKSRVHCALYYPPLGKVQTFEVWKMNIAGLEARNEELELHRRLRFDRKEIEAYAHDHWRSGKRANRWNGRQIKNAFQTAVALADWDNLQYTNGKGSPNGVLLRREHFEKVAAASRHFDYYLAAVRRADHVRAREVDLRDDNIKGVLQFGPNDSMSEDHDEDDEEDEGEEMKTRRKKESKSKKSSGRKKGRKSKTKPKSKKSRRRSDTESEDSGSEESSSEKSSSESESFCEAEEESLPSPPPEASKKKKADKTKKVKKRTNG